MSLCKFAFILLVVFIIGCGSTNPKAERFLKADAYYKSGSTYLEEGLSYHKKKDYKKATETFKMAVRDFEKAIGLDPDYKNPRIKLAFCYYYLYEYDKAIHHYNIILEKVPSHLDSLCRRAFCYAAKRDYKKALADLKELKKRMPSDMPTKKIDTYIQDFEKKLKSEK